MSLAYALYPTAEEENTTQTQTIEQSRQGRNKTIKKRPAEHVQKIWNTINGEGVSGKLYGSTPENTSSTVTAHDMDEMSMADFNPPPKAELSKVKQPTPEFEVGDAFGEHSLIKESFSGGGQAQQAQQAQQTQHVQLVQQQSPQSPSVEMPNTYAHDYYKQYVPYYNQLSQGPGNRDELLEKLNYMIHLLEETKDEKTGHVMEEIILFSFLGVFIIFIVDSFARVSKYER
jgi:hypothetical protein